MGFSRLPVPYTSCTSPLLPVRESNLTTPFHTCLTVHQTPTSLTPCCLLDASYLPTGGFVLASHYLCCWQVYCDFVGCVCPVAVHIDVYMDGVVVETEAIRVRQPCQHVGEPLSKSQHRYTIVPEVELQQHALLLVVLGQYVDAAFFHAWFCVLRSGGFRGGKGGANAPPFGG